MSNDNRQPKGVPAGGQFAAQHRSEPNLELKETDGQLPLAGFEPDLHHGQVRPFEAAEYLATCISSARQLSRPHGVTDSPYFKGMYQANAEVAAALLNPDAGAETIRAEGKQLAAAPPEVYEPGHEQHFADQPLTGRRCQQLAGHFLNEAIAVKKDMQDNPETDPQWERQGTFNVYVEASARFSDGVERRRRAGTREDEERIIARIRGGETDADHILKTIWDEDYQ